MQCYDCDNDANTSITATDSPYTYTVYYCGDCWENRLKQQHSAETVGQIKKNLFG